MNAPLRQDVFRQRALALAAAGICLLAASAPAVVPWTNSINTNNVITITNSPYNALGDGSTDNTSAISNALAAAAAGGNVGGLWGGTVRIPAPGTFLCGPLTLKNNLNLQIDAGATLKMLPVNLFIAYPPQTGNGLAYGDLLYAGTATNLEISGSGTIDGQGLQWWTNSAVSGSRPYMVYFNGKCSRVLIRDVTVQNPPKMHFVFKGAGDGNITFLRVNFNTTDSRANQCDGIDLVGTNCLIQDCTINAGDDNIALGSSSTSAFTANVLVTNCAFGTGHGVSLGSNTAGAVSNLTVINCTFNGTDYGIRMKSNDATSGGSGQGGLAQNLNYYNLAMTNITYGAVVIYSYYNSSVGGNFGTPTSVTPFFASTQAVDVTTVPVWRNITFSNVTASVGGGGVAGIIWGRTEVPATNIVFQRVNITAPNSFDLYNAQQIQFIDSQITATGSGRKTFALWNANLVVTNRAPASAPITLDGLGGNTNNSFALYNASGSMTSTDAFGASPITLGGAVLTNAGNFSLSGAEVLNFIVGTNTSRLAVLGNLALGGTNNILAGAGFTNGVYTLVTYSGTLSGSLPVLGTTPTNFNYTYTLKTNTPGQVDLAVTLGPPTNLVATASNLLIQLTWNPVSGATNYNLKRGLAGSGDYPTVFTGLSAAQYADAAVTNGVNYEYVVTALGPGGESTNSAPATAAPWPSNQPVELGWQIAAGRLALSWPQDHLGWRLQIQTNTLSQGISTNWSTVPDSTNTTAANIDTSTANGTVFLRLIYP